VAALFLLLGKVNLPGEAALPAAQSLAFHVVVLPIVGMEDQHCGGETRGGNGIWKHAQVLRAVAIFLNSEIAFANFRNRNDVVEGTFFLPRGQTPFV
jgi:hypothetical protein